MFQKTENVPFVWCNVHSPRTGSGHCRADQGVFPDGHCALTGFGQSGTPGHISVLDGTPRTGNRHGAPWSVVDRRYDARHAEQTWSIQRSPQRGVSAPGNVVSDQTRISSSRPVLSANESSGTSMQSSMVTNRLARGVFEEYVRDCPCRSPSFVPPASNNG